MRRPARSSALGLGSAVAVSLAVGACSAFATDDPLPAGPDGGASADATPGLDGAVVPDAAPSPADGGVPASPDVPEAPCAAPQQTTRLLLHKTFDEEPLWEPEFEVGREPAADDVTFVEGRRSVRIERSFGSFDEVTGPGARRSFADPVRRVRCAAWLRFDALERVTRLEPLRIVLPGTTVGVRLTVEPDGAAAALVRVGFGGGENYATTGPLPPMPLGEWARVVFGATLDGVVGGGPEVFVARVDQAAPQGACAAQALTGTVRPSSALRPGIEVGIAYAKVSGATTLRAFVDDLACVALPE